VTLNCVLFCITFSISNNVPESHAEHNERKQQQGKSDSQLCVVLNNIQYLTMSH
jgi:hypothetical protein